MKESRFGQGFRISGEGTGGDDEGVVMVANRVGDLINTDSLAKHCSVRWVKKIFFSIFKIG